MFWFSRNKESYPKIGEVWIFKSQRNPFDEIKRYKILAFKDDWLRMEHIQTGKQYDIEVSFFLQLYKPENASVVT